MSEPTHHQLRTSKLVRISSRDKDPESTSKYDLHVSFNDYMLHQARRVLLKSIHIPNTAYNVNKHNNTIVYDTGFGNIGFKVTPGQYNLTELADQLIVQFATQPVPVTLTYTIDTAQTKLILTFAGGITVSTEGSINGILGLDTDTDSVFPAGISTILPNIFDLSGLKKVFIGSHALAKGTTMTSSNKIHKNIFTEIPIEVTYGSIQHRTLSDLHTSDEVTHSTPFSVSNMDITLYDQDLNILDLNGRDWQLILKVFSE